MLLRARLRAIHAAAVYMLLVYAGFATMPYVYVSPLRERCCHWLRERDAITIFTPVSYALPLCLRR